MVFFGQGLASFANNFPIQRPMRGKELFIHQSVRVAAELKISVLAEKVVAGLRHTPIVLVFPRQRLDFFGRKLGRSLLLYFCIRKSDGGRV